MADSGSGSSAPGSGAGPRDWFVGQRVVDEEGFRGTVRYIGPVATAKDQSATWIGVEWDDPVRGKHDGSVLKADGTVVRHFACARPGPTSASFVKPAKLDRGVAFMEVLHRRYVGLDAPLEAPNQVFEGAYANTSRGGQKPIEFHGEEKIRARQQIGALTKVSMRGERVAWAGEEAVREEAAHLVEVDVQGNLWADWAEVGRLAAQMPRLEVLHLNSNRMLPLPAAPTPASSPLRGAFPTLRTLILNSCGIADWATVCNLERCLPALEQLGLARNEALGAAGPEAMAAALTARRAATGQPEEEGGCAHALFHRLRSLDLSGTGLRCWRQVALFSDLPELRVLGLNENELEAVGPAEEEGQEGADAAAGGGSSSSSSLGFTQLEALHLSCNRVASWASIDALTALPALHSLRFTSNPLVKGMGQSEARQLLIARVPGLTRLNGAEVSKRERADAEKSYIRRVARELGRLASPEAPAPEGQGGMTEEEQTERKAALLRRHHPRWLALVKLHGDVASLGGGHGGVGGGGGPGGPSTLAREMLSVSLVSMAAASMTQAPVEKKLPGSLTVGQLKQLCHKLFNLEPALQVLYYKSDPQAPPTMLDADGETLAYFGVPSGCQLFMNERDLQQEAREAAAREREEQARLEEQLRQVEMMDRLRRQQVGMDKLATATAAAGAAAAGGGVGGATSALEEQL